MQASTAIRARVVAGTVEVPGARLYYEVRGDGPPLLLTGPGMDAAALEPVADLLAADHTVITADPRGLNRSLPDDPDRSCGPGTRTTWPGSCATCGSDRPPWSGAATGP
jgi:pimeloyl-ACP methyl ester carboxylesterase